ncbi:MAG: hypothetical protein WCX08_03040 [Candidatus Buchananbacteria bacterium]|jgi:hypothetical protein
MEQLTPEEIEVRNTMESEALAENIKFLQSLVSNMGLEITSATPVEDERGRSHHSDLLSPEEEKQVS